MSKKMNFDNNNSFQEHYKINLIRVMKSGTYRINNHHKLIKAYGKDSIKPSLLQKLKQQSIFYQIWFSIFILLGVILLILDPTNWLNVFDLFIVMLNIYLVAKRKVIGIYVGLLECIIYGIICLFNGFYGDRNFILQSEQGETLAVANSTWVYADTQTGRPTRILPENISAYETADPYPMEYAPRKIPLPKEYRVMMDEQGESAERVVCDYVAGMTDRYAVAKFKEITIPDAWDIF